MTANPVVSLIASGEADRTTTLAALALEQSWVLPAGERLSAFAAACGVAEARAAAYEPLPGCQAYPAYVAWLALNASPPEAALALTANFAAWGGYCATIAEALRRHYGFPDEACAFFDFFAEPSPELDRSATVAVRAGRAAGQVDEARAQEYTRLLQCYEDRFWSTLVGSTPRGRGELRDQPHTTRTRH